MTTNPANFPPPVNISAAYPSLLGVFCDKCGAIFEGDFLVAEDWTKAQRLECVRAHVREKLGWSCDERGDFCPNCEASAPVAAVVDAHTVQGAALDALAVSFGHENWRAYVKEDLASGRGESRSMWEIVRHAVTGVLPIVERQAADLEARQPARPNARTWLAKELHNAGACEPGGEEDGQVVCDENCRNLAKMAQDVFLGGPIDWTKGESGV